MLDKPYLAHWKEQIDHSAGAIYLTLVDALALSIRRGDLREGDRLPPQRVIADFLGTNLTTVTRAFTEARRRGLVDATVGRGTFVRVGAGESHWRHTGPAVVDLTMNLPPVPQDPPLQRMIQADIAAILKQQDLNSLMSYRVTGGTMEERQLGAKWIAPAVGPRRVDEILVSPGAQTALAAIVSTLAQPGDVIVTDRIAYPGIRTIAAQFGLILAGVDSDGEGMLPDLLDRACAQHHPRLLYCIPTIHNPTTATMSLQRRRDILTVAQRHHLHVVEDDPYSLLMDGAPPALAALDHARVSYVATLAKTLSPGLRTAYVCLPNADMTRRVTAAIRAIALTNAGLLGALTARWMQTGQAGQILDAIRRELRLRQAIARTVLGEGHCMNPEGPHVWLKLPDWWGSADFVAYARRRGLALVPSTVFTISGDPPQRVRIALGSAADAGSLEESLRGVVSVLQHKRSPGFADIV
ncbi:transcriptional regulator, GntR family with aminotransferase domain [Gluconacetobacter diazotrophicus PA1 5]|uniref:aminotransferase-like domain-containing protein n=1 Tax=Gluconacetobacter diazotrophicus TaxID=33996 RepID=UPI000173DBE0|nr:PLP-dependent aminotransferase family protein [Gluconacetobacter diazotrophicus]ACI52359.1 transcriptional regulator, GntR family with aminotransferase domain [Gluconacetobacter diazotrophicus PA1 5]TWB05545.1 DNA-binding transcriptional MocR family regulator [Gluconacetobacter diazotrophicus]